LHKELIAPTLLLLSEDKELRNLVLEVVKAPWEIVCNRTNGHRIFSQQNVRLIILDDQAVEELDRSWLLSQIRKEYSGRPLLYVAGDHSEQNERRARTNGAHYYVSKPLVRAQFGHVLLSFVQVQQAKT
jgi:DNA-binding response OmpR family regulator